MQVVLAVPNYDLRLALELFLGEERGIFVVGSVGDAISALALVTASLPDLLVVTWDVPDGSTARLIRETRSLQPAPQVIVLGSDESARAEALAAGATAFVSSWGPVPDLLLAIRQCDRRNLASGQTGSLKLQAG